MDIVKQGGQQASRGFTLIEMSIVLVIIGLIIGGILKGQEIVNSAREKQVINQINSVRAAQNTYVDRHNALPGDDPSGNSVSPAATNGNGDGLVGAPVSGTAGFTASAIKTLMGTAANENVGYFVEMVAENLIGNAFVVSTATAPTNFGVANLSPLPSTAFSGAGLGALSGNHGGNTTYPTSVTDKANWLTIFSFNNTGGVTARTASHIDAEVDDGNPDTGLVRGNDVTTECNAANAASYSSGNLDKATCDVLIMMVQ